MYSGHLAFPCRFVRLKPMEDEVSLSLAPLVPIPRNQQAPPISTNSGIGHTLPLPPVPGRPGSASSGRSGGSTVSPAPGLPTPQPHVNLPVNAHVGQKSTKDADLCLEAAMIAFIRERPGQRAHMSQAGDMLHSKMPGMLSHSLGMWIGMRPHLFARDKSSPDWVSPQTRQWRRMWYPASQ